MSVGQIMSKFAGRTFMAKDPRTSYLSNVCFQRLFAARAIQIPPRVNLFSQTLYMAFKYKHNLSTNFIHKDLKSDELKLFPIHLAWFEYVFLDLQL